MAAEAAVVEVVEEMVVPEVEVLVAILLDKMELTS
jgi:hypothetical protein